ncbi:protein S40-4 [Rutidosis leptorrhynchoides]|uniref:protein S40-4 n=1 Tax=Rutidosis leptorrhynchoides TaxID=125765 RepID=UPI003A9A54A1
MAASKTYSNYRFFSGEITGPMDSGSLFELDESDIWNVSVSPESRKPLPASRITKRSSTSASAKRTVGGTASSLPVSVPDWSKILKQDYTENRRRDSDDDDFDDDYNSGEDRIPPHEFLARTRMASFSVHEGIGRTLKGRDLSRVRNAIWEKTGFED